jgi:hypothetical protein
VQHERDLRRAELGDDEGHALGHQPGDEGDIAREPVELRDDDRALARLPGCERRGQLRPPVEGVGALPRLDLGELATSAKPSASANRATAARCASMPRPDRPCLAVETR